MDQCIYSPGAPLESGPSLLFSQLACTHASSRTINACAHHPVASLASTPSRMVLPLQIDALCPRLLGDTKWAYARYYCEDGGYLVNGTRMSSFTAKYVLFMCISHVRHVSLGRTCSPSRHIMFTLCIYIFHFRCVSMYTYIMMYVCMAKYLKTLSN